MKYLDKYEAELRNKYNLAMVKGDLDSFVKWARDKHYQSFLAGKKAALKDKADS